MWNLGYTGAKPNRAMEQMVWYELIGLASLKELEAFITSRKCVALAQPQSRRPVGLLLRSQGSTEPPRWKGAG